ncbi:MULTISPECIES: MarR family winged helix-turn-helix transcriptional regulator [Actinomadura]|jgi:DNA-binding MarR family transcriptional regulator|uniref:Winged helix-turn-helix transcriptional regulator n=1 Tax=Actinomadura geliboluensis TaxID=882440 RepID=A0A5S4GZG1_9ACTN|nr:MarR family winged helix-turn-helix transcriptional regulator [Actinomadura geliboluensis]TMR38363.1 winged helix-turn-helix transcriptional regulator [Actinomadura geliboluensis]
MTTTGVPQHELDLPRVLARVERDITARLGAALKTAGSTVEEWRVTSLLSDGSGHPMTEIAEHALLPAPTLTKVVDRLVSAGLVYRRPDEEDRRRILVFLSERGQEEVTRLTAAVEAEWARVQDAVGREELALLRALLTRISTHLP